MPEQLENLRGRKQKTHVEMFVDIITEPLRKPAKCREVEAMCEGREESDKELSREIIAVTSDSMAVSRESLALAKDTMEKDRKMQRQFLEAIQRANALLQHMLLLGQQAIQFCKPTRSHVIQPLVNTGYREE